jgi:hypothetical protein
MVIDHILVVRNYCPHLRVDSMVKYKSSLHSQVVLLPLILLASKDLIPCLKFVAFPFSLTVATTYELNPSPYITFLNKGN